MAEGGERMKENGGQEVSSPRHSQNSQEEDEDIKNQEWEKRLMTGDLPEDFLSVTEPKVDKAQVREKQAPAAVAEPQVGNLVDVVGAGAAVAIPAGGDAAAAAPEELLARARATEKPKLEAKTSVPMSTEEQDRAMALALQEQLNMEEHEAAAASQDGAGFYAAAPRQTVAAPENMIGRLTVTIVEAKLTKNYGFSRMDPYCRVRVGHSVYETPTCANGSKEPKWNKTFNCYLLQGIRNMELEIYDECTFSTDPLIATATYPLPESVTVRHEVADEWLTLSGQEGPDKEGMVHVILSLQPIAPGAPLQVAPQMRMAPNVGAGHKPMAYQTAYAPAGGQAAPTGEEMNYGYCQKEVTRHDRQILFKCSTAMLISSDRLPAICSCKQCT